MGLPVLLGTSRKGFIGQIVGQSDPAERLSGTLATVALGVACGAQIFRVSRRALGSRSGTHGMGGGASPAPLIPGQRADNDKMSGFFDFIQNFRWLLDPLDVVIVAFIIYRIILLIKGTPCRSDAVWTRCHPAGLCGFPGRRTLHTSLDSG